MGKTPSWFAPTIRCGALRVVPLLDLRLARWVSITINTSTCDLLGRTGGSVDGDYLEMQVPFPSGDGSRSGRLDYNLGGSLCCSRAVSIDVTQCSRLDLGAWMMESPQVAGREKEGQQAHPATAGASKRRRCRASLFADGDLRAGPAAHAAPPSTPRSRIGRPAASFLQGCLKEQPHRSI